MGILDDAIREHLELKRAHGVPEEELQRQEEEALGPARRDVAQQPEESEPAPGEPAADEANGAGQAAEPAIAEAEHESPLADETAVFDMEQDAAEAEVDQAPPPPTPEPRAEQTAVHEVPEAEDPEPAEPTAVEPTPVEPPPVEPPPVEDEVPAAEPERDPFKDDPELAEEIERAEEGELAEAEGEGDEDPLAGDPEDDELDVLEDTPDFLQETPEHDRLWFEQKPPRDFDFD